MAYRKLGRTSAHRKSMLRNLTTDLIVNGRIVTTETRAKEVRKFADKMITFGKKGDLASRRRAAAFMMDVVADVKEEEDKVVVQTALQKLFDDVALVSKTVTVVTHASSRWMLAAVMLQRWLCLN